MALHEGRKPDVVPLTPNVLDTGRGSRQDDRQVKLMTKTSGNWSGRRLLRVVVASLVPLWSLIWVSPAGAGTADAPTWSTIAAPQSPPGLQYASAAYDADDQTVVVFGGQESDGTLSDDTWIWNGTTWTEASAQVSGPTPRDLAALAYDASLHQLILFGGEAANGSQLDDTWAWNGQSWVPLATQQAASGTGPAAREGASLAVDATGNLVLFGGTGNSSVASNGVGGTVSAASLTSDTTRTPDTTVTLDSADITDTPDAADTTTTTTPSTTTTTPTTTTPTTTTPTTTTPTTTTPAGTTSTGTTRTPTTSTGTTPTGT
jgi:hypothetical protein